MGLEHGQKYRERVVLKTCILLTGGVLQAFMFPSDGSLGRLGNSIAWWLGIEPYELFLYVFLPPLLLDAAVRIDFFLFKRVRPISTKNI